MERNVVEFIINAKYNNQNSEKLDFLYSFKYNSTEKLEELACQYKESYNFIQIMDKFSINSGETINLYNELTKVSKSEFIGYGALSNEKCESSNNKKP